MPFTLDTLQWIRFSKYVSIGIIFAEEPVEFVRHLQDQTLKELPNTVTFECELSKANVKVCFLVLTSFKTNLILAILSILA